MLKMYSDFKPLVEETELEFCKRKMQDRGVFIGEQKATILKLRRALDDISEILEEVSA